MSSRAAVGRTLLVQRHVCQSQQKTQEQKLTGSPLAICVHRAALQNHVRLHDRDVHVLCQHLRKPAHAIAQYSHSDLTDVTYSR